MLKFREDFLQIYHAFSLWVENFLRLKTKAMLSNGARELLSCEFQSELQQNSSLHRISCPYIPQQNWLNANIGKLLTVALS